MICKKCGTESPAGRQYCVNCGADLFTQAAEAPKPVAVSPVKKTILYARMAIGVIALLIYLGIRIYNAVDDSSIRSNNQGLDSLNSGNEEQAIKQLQDAANYAVTNDTKIATLKNLGYAYETNGQNDAALTTFQKALSLAAPDSFDHYLVAGEIDLLNANFSSANTNLNQAYKMQPNDYQVNNTLAIFYLDLDSAAPDYVDYPKAVAFAKTANSIQNSEISRENLGIAYFFNDDYDQSITFLSQSNLSQHPEIAIWLGYDYMGKEDAPTAKKYFQLAVDAGLKLPQEVLDYMKK